jgi:hypothetical protein
VIQEQVHRGPGNEGRKLLQEFDGLEEEVRRAIAPHRLASTPQPRKSRNSRSTKRGRPLLSDVLSLDGERSGRYCRVVADEVRPDRELAIAEIIFSKNF